MKRITLLAIAAIVVGLMAAPAVEASCVAARAVTSATATSQAYLYTPGQPFTPVANYPYTPYGYTTTYYINGYFWAHGSGNPAVGLGVDNGTFKGESPIWGGTPPGSYQQWINTSYYGSLIKAFLGGAIGHWNTPGSDGCISTTGSDGVLPDQGECNVVAIADPVGANGYFIALSTPPNAVADFVYAPENGFPAQLNLAPIPKPFIKDSGPLPGDDRFLVVGIDPGDPRIFAQNGWYLKCAADQILLGYRLYARMVPTGSTMPAGINTRQLNGSLPGVGIPVPLPPWQLLGQGTCTGNGQCQDIQVTVPCDEGLDAVLCTSLLFGGVEPGSQPYELKSCSVDSTRKECGPVHADPDDKPKTDIRQNPRPKTTSGRTGGR
jgi:hypothetical protein